VTITTLGIDLAKTSFQLHGVDEKGRKVFGKKLSRSKMIEFISNLPPCTIAMEACGSSHHFGRKFTKMGHTVKLIAPQYVKPFVKTQKNDRNDAEAIVEASVRPSMNFVTVKTVEQQDVQLLHRVRSRLVGSRTALMNEMRGTLAEYGVVIPVGISNLKKAIPEILEQTNNELTNSLRSLVEVLSSELRELETRIDLLDVRVKDVFEQSESAKRIAKIEGIGVITATAMVAAVGDAKQFKSSRQMSAWLGLVPRQNSTGGKTKLLGITKKGDRYLRCLLVHGGRSVVRLAAKKDDSRSKWVADKHLRRGANRAAVAVANKNARIIWKLLVSGEEYRSAT
jgi:transposase